MLPVVHAVFPVAHPAQWFSPVATLLFSLFYPATLFLHLLGMGSLADDGLVTLLEIRWQPGEVWAPLPFLGVYLLAALLAIRWKMGFLGTALLALGFGGRILWEWV